MDNFMYKDQLAPPAVAQFLHLVHSSAHAFLQVGYVFSVLLELTCLFFYHFTIKLMKID